MRTGWDSYFMGIAYQAATRASCDRAKVGCVLVVDRQIVATGYNGSISRDIHCDEAGHLLRDDHCVRVVHAEMNAVAQAAKRGSSIDNSRAYITHFPCWPCFKVLINAGVKSIVYGEDYKNDVLVRETATRLGIELHMPIRATGPASGCGWSMSPTGHCFLHGCACATTGPTK